MADNSDINSAMYTDTELDSENEDDVTFQKILSRKTRQAKINKKKCQKSPRAIGVPKKREPIKKPSTSIAEPANTSNRFLPLALNEQNEKQEEDTTEKPPPTIVKNIQFNCRTNKNLTTIKFETSNGYRKAVHYLNNIGADYHTYQLMEDRAFRVVIWSLHEDTPVDEIKQDLEKKKVSRYEISLM
jgi:hypothetical protein